MSFTLHLSPFIHNQLYHRLQQAYAGGALRLVRRIHALLALAEAMSVGDVGGMLALGEHTVRGDRNQFLWQGVASLVSKSPPSRPSKLTKTQRQELAKLIKGTPPAMGYTSGCWNTLIIQDLIQRRFGVEYHPHSICTLMHNLGFSYYKARFVSEYLKEAKPLECCQTRWAQILRQVRQSKALLHLGDEVSFAQGGSLSYPWAPKGQQPEGPTSGKRKAYKVCGLIDSFSGRLCYKAHSGRCNSASYVAFLFDVLSQTRRHVFVRQDGARSRTNKAMQECLDAHADRLTIEQLPAYGPDFNPIEHLWKKIKKAATHRKYFPEFAQLQVEVDRALFHFAQTPHEITVLMARYCESLWAIAA